MKDEPLITIVAAATVSAIVSLGLILLNNASKNIPETKCVGGYVFTNRCNAIQILDSQGQGIKCESVSTPQ